MKARLSLALIAFITLLSSCRRFDLSDYVAVCRDGFSKLEVAKQLDRQYPAVDHFIVSGGLGKQPAEWQSVAFIEGRFDLTYIAHVNVDYSRLSATPVGEGQFLLVAASTIRVLDPDRAETTYDGKLERRFGMEQWKRFVESGFDLTSLGIPKEEIHSVPHWDTHVHGWRKDRVSIK